MNVESFGFVGKMASILGLSFASGVNLYAAMLTVGLGLRLGWITGLPKEMDILANPVVLGAAGIMYLAEFIADKIPGFTPIWDAVHTFIRPVGGALLAMQAAGNLSPAAQAAAALLGGSIAFGSHSTKAGVRLLAHAAPEPTTHSAISVVEDVGVVSLLVLAYSHPEIALPILLGLILIAIAMAPLLFRIGRFVVGGLAGRFRSFGSREPSSQDVAGWLQHEVTALQLPLKPEIVRVYLRSGSLFSRLKEAWLVRHGNDIWLGQKRTVGSKLKRIADNGFTDATLLRGVLYNVVEFTPKQHSRTSVKPMSVYVTKEWSRACARLLGLVATEGAVQTTEV